MESNGTIDNFIIERVAEEERAALTQYNNRMKTCMLRRQFVFMYRTARNAEQKAAMFRVLREVAALWCDHPQFEPGWMPREFRPR
jgi:hypothetical protein